MNDIVESFIKNRQLRQSFKHVIRNMHFRVILIKSMLWRIRETKNRDRYEGFVQKYWFVLHIYQWSFVMGWQSIFPMNNQYVLYVVSLITLQRWSLSHGDVIKWKHVPRYWPFIRGIHRSPVNSLHKGQWRGALMFTLICARINGWVNNCEAGDLWRHRTHYDVIVMVMIWS